MKLNHWVVAGIIFIGLAACQADLAIPHGTATPEQPPTLTPFQPLPRTDTPTPLPSLTPSITPTATPIPTMTPLPTWTPVPSITPFPTDTPYPLIVPRNTPTDSYATPVATTIISATNSPYRTPIPRPDNGLFLRDYAETQRIKIGALIDHNGIQYPIYRETIAREFNAVSISSFFFRSVHPQPDTYNFSRADVLVDFATANNLYIRGHTLIFSTTDPGWISGNDSWTREALTQVMKDHIHTVVGRYKGRVNAWDVVNEGLNDNGNLRDSVWLRTIGSEYIAMAFRFAHDADPNAKLFYNEAGTEVLDDKFIGLYNLMRVLKSQNVPVDGVGLQMHLNVLQQVSASDLAAKMQKLGELGLIIHITELDVRLPDPPSEDDLYNQAVIYREVMRACLQAGNCKAYMMWGFTDKFSWISGNFPGWGSALIFDESYKPKLSYYGIIDGFPKK